jgi:predicted nucleotidyltransferase
MAIGFALDRDGIARVCRAYGVSRLQVFGSASSERFDKELSGVDLLVEFLPGAQDAFAAYFGLKEDLEELLDRPVELVMSIAVHKPYIAASVARSAVQV